MLKKRNIIIIGLLVIIIGGVTIFKVKDTSSKNASVKTVTVKKDTITNSISASGKIQADIKVDLKFQTSGELVYVGVKEGDKIEKWQVIAQLDQRELQRKLLKALRDYSKERWDFEQDKTVTYKDIFVTDTIKRILEKNQFDLDKSIADVEIADIALKYSALVSPISGIVTSIDTPIANINITPSNASFTVVDPNSLTFKADIDESDISNIKEGQEVLITLDAYPDKEIKGIVSSIGFVSETTSGGGNGFPIKIKLPENEDLKYKVGMNGDIKIIIKEIDNVISIPTTAITKENGKKFIFVKERDKKIKKEITTGYETDEYVEIKTGLSPGDKVIVE